MLGDVVGRIHQKDGDLGVEFVCPLQEVPLLSQFNVGGPAYFALHEDAYSADECHYIEFALHILYGDTMAR